MALMSLEKPNLKISLVMAVLVVELIFTMLKVTIASNDFKSDFRSFLNL